MLLNKYSDFGGGKKKSDSEFLSYNLMLNSGKKNSRFARQKKNILTLVLSEKKILNEAKNHNPPFKLNGRSLSNFREDDFSRNQPIRSKNCLWWPCLLTDQDEIGNLYRGPTIDASYEVTVHLTKQFQRRFF
jgi:hypothetical protein